MATYVPNANQTTQPTEDKTVESAALELRTLKTHAVQYLTADPLVSKTTLPAAAARAGKLLAFDSITGEPVIGPLPADITLTQANIAAIQTVAASIADVNTVAPHVVQLDTVAPHVANVDIVATDITNVNTVATDIANVNIAALNVADINNFADVYQGAKAAAPAIRNDGSALISGDLYFNTANDRMWVYETGTGWIDYEINAQTAATAASGSASAASGSAAAALVSEGNADTSEAAALAAKVAAESARDAALIQAGVYTTEALGRAAVADGVAFKVQGSGDVAAYEYRRTNSTTSVLIATYPSASAVSTLSYSGYTTTPTVSNILRGGSYVDHPSAQSVNYPDLVKYGLTRAIPQSTLLAPVFQFSMTAADLGGMSLSGKYFITTYLAYSPNGDYFGGLTINQAYISVNGEWVLPNNQSLTYKQISPNLRLWIYTAQVPVTANPVVLYTGSFNTGISTTLHYVTGMAFGLSGSPITINDFDWKGFYSDALSRILDLQSRSPRLRNAATKGNLASRVGLSWYIPPEIIDNTYPELSQYGLAGLVKISAGQPRTLYFDQDLSGFSPSGKKYITAYFAYSPSGTGWAPGTLQLITVDGQFSGATITSSGYKQLSSKLRLYYYIGTFPISDAKLGVYIGEQFQTISNDIYMGGFSAAVSDTAIASIDELDWSNWPSGELGAAVLSQETRLTAVEAMCRPGTWQGKKIIWVGTSIPAGNLDAYAYPAQAGALLAANVVNEAQSGSRVIAEVATKGLALTAAECVAGGISPAYSYENKLIGKNADLIVFDHGYNDQSISFTDITTRDRSTVVGAINYIIDKIYLDKPTTRICILANCYKWAGGNPPRIESLRQSLKAVASYWGVPFFDWGEQSGINPTNYTQYMSDSVHPSLPGWTLLGKQSARWLQNIA